jgi:hypothetical protein
MIDDDECGAVGGMSGRGNQSTQRKPAPVPLCPPQIPYVLEPNPGRLSWKQETNRLSYGKTSGFVVKKLVKIKITPIYKSLCNHIVRRHAYGLYWLCILWGTSVNSPYSVITDIGYKGHAARPPLVLYKKN